MTEILDPRRGRPLHPVQTPRERGAFDRGLLRAAHLRRRDHLHGAGDLSRAADRADAPSKVAWLFMADAEVGALFPGLLELIGGGLERRDHLFGQRLFASDPLEQIGLAGRQELGPLRLELLDPLDGTSST